MKLKNAEGLICCTEERQAHRKTAPAAVFSENEKHGNGRKNLFNDPLI